MEHRELVNHLSHRTSYTKREIRLILKAIASVIQEAIGSGRDVQLEGVGKFLNLPQPQRVGGHPVTKKRMIIPATRRIKFEPAVKMKKVVRKSLKYFKDEDPEVKYGLKKEVKEEEPEEKPRSTTFRRPSFRRGEQ